MQIAIFGGSFDPPHIGHETIAKEILKKLDIDLLVVVPAYLNPLKVKSSLDAKTRYNLLKKMFFKKEKIKVSKYEIKKEKAVYSIKTIKHMIKKYKPTKVYLIIGADNYKSFDLWHKHDEIKDLVTLVVVTRDGFEYENIESIEQLKVDVKISSTKLRDTLNLDYIPKKIKKSVKKNWQKKGKN